MSVSIRAYIDFGKLGALRLTVEREELIKLLKRSVGKGKPLALADFSIDLVQLPLVLKETEPRPGLSSTMWIAESATEAANILREFAKSEGVGSYMINEIEREGRGSEERASSYCRLLGIPPGIVWWPETSSSR